MSEINYFKKIILYSDDMTADVNHLHVKRIRLDPLLDHLYIVKEDKIFIMCNDNFAANMDQLHIRLLLYS
jgi:hypothetical protein